MDKKIVKICLLFSTLSLLVFLVYLFSNSPLGYGYIIPKDSSSFLWKFSFLIVFITAILINYFIETNKFEIKQIVNSFFLMIFLIILALNFEYNEPLGSVAESDSYVFALSLLIIFYFIVRYEFYLQNREDKDSKNKLNIYLYEPFFIISLLLLILNFLFLFYHTSVFCFWECSYSLYENFILLLYLIGILSLIYIYLRLLLQHFFHFSFLKYFQNKNFKTLFFVLLIINTLILGITIIDYLSHGEYVKVTKSTNMFYLADKAKKENDISVCDKLSTNIISTILYNNLTYEHSEFTYCTYQYLSYVEEQQGFNYEKLVLICDNSKNKIKCKESLDMMKYDLKK